MQNLPKTYEQILDGVKAEMRQSRLKAVLSANAYMLALYWRSKAAVNFLQPWYSNFTEVVHEDWW